MTKLLSDHLQSNPRRRHGAQGGMLVPCQRSKHHGHHPIGELCPLCEPAAPLRSEKCLGQRYYEWWLGTAATSGLVGDDWDQLETGAQHRWQRDAEQYIAFNPVMPDWVIDGQLDFGWPY